MSVSTDQYLPRVDSLPHRVCSYFARLTDEELSHQDIALKWQCDQKNIPVQLKQAVDAGLLKRDGTVYSAGPNIGRMGESAPMSTPFVGLKPPGKRRAVPPPIDIESIEFQTGLPTVLSAHERWVTKLQTMKADQWFDVPMEHANALRAAAKTVRKSGKRVRVLMHQGDGQDMVRVVCVGDKE